MDIVPETVPGEGGVRGGDRAKTENLLRLDPADAALVKNDNNPNKMTTREFDLLVDNMEKTGLTDPILVRPLNFEAVLDVAAKLDMPDPELVLAKGSRSSASSEATTA